MFQQRRADHPTASVQGTCKKAKIEDDEGSTERECIMLSQSHTEAGDYDEDDRGDMYSSLDDVQMSVFLNETPACKELVRQDPVHSEISLPRELWKLVETDALQRLAHLEQLGACSHVFPRATHTRLQHSIGVCYLAKLMLEAIEAQVAKMYELASDQERLPGLVSRKDKLCVMVAALAHDAGHGPKSHLFDRVVEECFDNERQGCANRGTKWSHEAQSARMVRRMLEEHRGRHVWSSLCDLEEIDITFICECIVGNDLHELPEHEGECNTGKSCEERRRGRDRSKAYLYDIVSNIHSGLDLDKIDYLMRDPLCVFGPNEPSYAKGACARARYAPVERSYNFLLSAFHFISFSCTCRARTHGTHAILFLLAVIFFCTVSFLKRTWRVHQLLQKVPAPVHASRGQMVPRRGG